MVRNLWLRSVTTSETKAFVPRNLQTVPRRGKEVYREFTSLGCVRRRTRHRCRFVTPCDDTFRHSQFRSLVRSTTAQVCCKISPAIEFIKFVNAIPTSGVGIERHRNSSSERQKALACSMSSEIFHKRGFRRRHRHLADADEPLHSIN